MVYHAAGVPLVVNQVARVQVVVNKQEGTQVLDQVVGAKV